MDSRYHFFVSSLFAVIAFLSGDIVSSFLCIIVGWLIDVDHEVDYFYEHGRFVFNPIEAFNELGHVHNSKLYIPLHGWEWLILLVIFSREWVYLLVVLSYLSHLLMDLRRVGFVNMSVLFRWKNGWVDR